MWYKPRLIHGQLGLKQIIGSNNSLSFSSLDGAKINRSVNNTPFEIALLRALDRPRNKQRQKNHHPALVQKKMPPSIDRRTQVDHNSILPREFLRSCNNDSYTILCNTHRMPRYSVSATLLLNRSTALLPTAVQPFS